ncbi:MAG: hypothetical protein R2865_00230 [Deinococcales bacterium]
MRRSTGNKRDEGGVLGSINWLRRQMEAKGANPNKSNIIYRDKVRSTINGCFLKFLTNFDGYSHEPLQVPDSEVLLSTGRQPNKR